MKNKLSVLEKVYVYYLQCSGVSSDSRKLVTGTMFFALKGTNYDGNAFASHALSIGAKYVVIDNPAYYEEDERYILVENVLITLQQLAKFHRAHLTIPIVGITGSMGKTTTKELLGAALGVKYTCYITQGNLNNHIGVPISLLSIKPSVEIAVIEMGANHIGEIAMLCEICKPTHGIILNVDKVHLEGFGSLEGIIKAKNELYTYLIKHEGIGFINSTDPLLTMLGKKFQEPIYYPKKDDFYHAELVEAKPYVIYKNEENQSIPTYLIGKHHFYNIAAALCIAKYFGVNTSNADKKIQNYIPVNNRSQIINKNTVTIFLDACNANPASMQAAIEAFDFFTAPEKILILGDMNELGEESLYFHKKIIELTTKRNYKQILLYGSNMGKVCSFNSQAMHFKTKQELETYLTLQNFLHTAILIKGSSSHKLGQLVDFIGEKSNLV